MISMRCNDVNGKGTAMAGLYNPCDFQHTLVRQILAQASNEQVNIADISFTFMMEARVSLPA